MEGTTPTPGTPEYEAFIAQKAENVTVKTYTPDGQLIEQEASTETSSAPPSDRPAGLPEKFNSWEDMAKAYSELEKKLGQPKDPAAEPPPEGGDPASLEIEPPANLPANVTESDFAKYNQEFMEKGELSDTTYEDLAKKGIPRETVDAYIAGQYALVEKRQAAGFDLVGGKDSYQQMVQWAAANLTKDETAAFNTAVNGSWELAQIAIQGLQARYTKAAGKNPSLVQGTAGNEGGSMAFTSREEVKAAMRDPRYKVDSAYRNQIAERLRVTPNSVI